MTYLIAAALAAAAPAPADAAHHPQGHQQKMDCCKEMKGDCADCCKDMAGKHDGHDAGQHDGHPAE